MIEVVIDSIRISLVSQHRIVMLKDPEIVVQGKGVLHLRYPVRTAR